MALRLRKVENGLYETQDGRYRVERIDGYGAPADGSDTVVATQCWTLNRRVLTSGRADYEEIAERQTKRECVAALEQRIAAEG